MTQQKKFNHKYLSLTAVEEEGLAQIYDPEEVCIEEVDITYLEESNDWQEITLELVKDRWIITKNNKTARIDYLKGNFAKSYNFHYKSPQDGLSLTIFQEDIEREATPDEIHKALEAIRIEKGLVEGVKIKDAETGEVRILVNNDYIYQKGQNFSIDTFSGEYIADGGSYATCKLYSRGNWATKVSEPILVTEDGVEVFDNERLYVPQVDNTIEDFTVSTIMRARNNKSRSDAETVFYYKENAQAYIENNKPRFSRAEYEADLEWLRERACGTAASIAPYSFNHARFYHELNKLIQNLKQSK